MAKVESKPEQEKIDIQQEKMTGGESSQTKPSMKLGDDVKAGENFFYENQFDDMEFWMKLAEEWHSNDMTGGDLLADIDTNVVQIREPLENLLKSNHPYHYKLMQNNPFILAESKNQLEEKKNVEMHDYIEQGKHRMQVGDLSAAVLLFEAAAQQQPENVEAWHLLGIANAKNENDHKSIAAFKRCLSLQPKDEQIILESLMYLATSFTNESMTTEACNSLQEWLNNHPKYRDLANKESDEPYLGPTPLSKRWIQKSARIGNPFSNGLFDSLRENFLEAARLSVEQPDPDVQCGLGVLHNLSGEYEKAMDCFRTALDSRPDDYSLWNRYGASLANGGRAEESMSAYREALIRYPGYIRARYNLAISCMMMGLGEEAAEHLLSVLNLQTAGADSIKDMVDLNRDNITSTSVWSLLRSAMSMHGRIDLLDLVDQRDLERLTIEFHKPKPQETEDDVDDDGDHNETEIQSNID
ncbi:peroxisomal biogenesis factor 5-like protein [Euroglyphus maynei]|uniref:Peroxisomal biogenesis factor 5-like protein n=1 Tax=Euroglyphus maynei TaxID=6958 RepID=A0A1Y3AKW3_EURMA|nr:peroxisomal biogenesis factor 5-like protein [Euroglyphus maynei]